MGAFTLEVRCTGNVDGIAADPQPDWSFDALLLELNSLEVKLNASSRISTPFSQPQAEEFATSKGKNRISGAFVMQVLDDEMDNDTDSEEENDHYHDQTMVVGRRFTCEELSLSESEDFEEELAFGKPNELMDSVGFVEGALSELSHDQQLSVMEEIRSQIIELETDLANESEKFSSNLARIEKYTEAKRETDRKFDMQYQRKIAESLDNHLTAVQRDHEHKSQIEEKKIRDDAVREEAQRKEKALHEEKLRLEKIKAEAEMQARLEAEKAEAAKAASLEADRRAAKEAAEKETSERRNIAVAGAAEDSAEGNRLSKGSGSHVTKSKPSAGNVIKSSETALKLEERRFLTYKEVAAQKDAWQLGANWDYRKNETKIARYLRMISGTKENVSEKADALLNLICDPSYPQSIGVTMFVEKFISRCETMSGSFTRSLYAYGHIIVFIASKVPLVMDILIAQLNKVCIYTVPKYIAYSKSAFETTKAYYKAIGYQEVDGKIESADSYIDRMSSYMRLYGALVQTEVVGIQNLHGIAEAWAWLARFLNALPPNTYTVVALQSFLEMAGFALHRRYRTQFKKILHMIDRYFLSAVSDQKAQKDPKLNMAIANIRNYIQSNKFLEEPAGWQLESHIDSSTCVP